ncbi:hypothetical protein GCM10022221_10140 [Actinocorallia aurea]
MTDIYTETHHAHIKHLRSLDVRVDDEGMLLGGTYVMFFAEADLMGLHADALLSGVRDADVLEVGLGLGIFAEQMAKHRPASYTAIEPHPEVAAMTWQRALQGVAARVAVLRRPWQLTECAPSAYDAIMYDTWPPDGHADADFASFVEHVAVQALRPGGRFSFFSSGPRLAPERERVLDRFFTSWSQTSYEMSSRLVPRGWTKPTAQFVVPVAIR